MYNASLDDKRALRKMVKETRGTNDRVSLEKFYDIFEKYKNKYFLHWIQHLPGAGARLQRFFLSFLLEFKGISRSGLDLLSCFGLAVPIRSYDRYKKEAVAATDNLLR